MLYSDMKEIGVDCFYIELLEECVLENITQLRAKEGEWIRKLNSWKEEFGYNKKIETRTKTEYYNDTKEHVLEKVKQYYFTHKEQVEEYIKKHYENNIEHFKEYKRKWYLEHKETHNMKAKERIICECGNEICRGYLTQHLKSNKHKQLLEQKAISEPDQEINYD